MLRSIEQIIAQAAEPERGRQDFARFEATCHASSVGAFNWNREGARTLTRIFGNSHILAERLIAHPDWAEAIVDSPFWNARKPKTTMIQELEQAIAAQPDDEGFVRALRQMKYRELARLVARDLTGSIDTNAMLAEWTELADVLIEAASMRALNETRNRFGTPRCTHAEGTPADCGVCIIGLGKLGGNELNISSDIDLLVLYTSDQGQATREDESATSLHECFVTYTRRFTRLLAQVTPDGFVFRVDHDLRPEGLQGPLANSVAAAERYYEYFGSDWERQALIRARPVAGDIALGERFLEAMRPFVYRRSISLADLTHMCTLKERMERKVLRRRNDDIKHGKGSIREAEFLVQAFQLLFGGARPELRTSNTFDAIDFLSNAEIIHPDVAARLHHAWAFLRRTENMLQAVDDVQTHRLPDDMNATTALARRMGYVAEDGTQEFSAQLSQHRQAIARLFRALFEADYERLEFDEVLRENVARAADEEEAADSLAWFKKREVQRIVRLDLEGRLPIGRVLRRLSLVAEAAIEGAWRMARLRLAERYGNPRTEQGDPAGFAIVALGRLGAREIDYGSDLDLIFLYEEKGTTDGERPIANVEFFTKLAQRTISLISLMTRYGRTYLVDAELRPSGGQGTLVASLATFCDYHERGAALWERQALLKARVIAGDEAFTEKVEHTLDHLAFELTPPKEKALREEIDHLRSRFIDERARETETVRNLKIGPGGLADIESIIRHHQLLHVPAYPELRRQNSDELLDALAGTNLIEADQQDKLQDALAFLRQLLARLRLLLGHDADRIDANAAYLPALAEGMGYENPASLISELDRVRETVRTIYAREIKQS